MKEIGLIILLSFIAFSCKKEKVPTTVQKSFYQSNGNFLVLKVGDELEAAYEYQLSSTSLSNDSLPLNWDSSDAGIDGMTMHYFLTFDPNEDTIIQHVNNYFSYNAQLIDIWTYLSVVFFCVYKC
jgi:hypothetical protein